MKFLDSLRAGANKLAFETDRLMRVAPQGTVVNRATAF
jgi:hypothetical protein